MRSYECLYIVHPAADTTELDQSVADYSELIEKNGGTVSKADIWGKRQLAYPINHLHEGNYILLRFEGNEDVLKTMEQSMRIKERVLRHMITYEIPEGAGYNDELMVLTEKKPRPPRRGGDRGGRFRRNYRDSRPREDYGSRPDSGQERPAAGDSTPSAPQADNTTPPAEQEGGQD